MNKLFTFLICLLISLYSCRNVTVIDPYFFQNGMEEVHMQAKLAPFKNKSKTFRIINAHIDANLLYLNIEYKASCNGNDFFEFLGGELFNNDQNIQCREARLFISGSSENCTIKNDTKIIDLRALTSTEVRDAEVLLHIGGWRTKMTYVYVPHKN